MNKAESGAGKPQQSKLTDALHFLKREFILLSTQINNPQTRRNIFLTYGMLGISTHILRVAGWNDPCVSPPCNYKHPESGGDL